LPYSNEHNFTFFLATDVLQIAPNSIATGSTSNEASTANYTARIDTSSPKMAPLTIIPASALGLEGEDIYVSDDGTDNDSVMPAIDRRYLYACDQERALYVLGVPGSYQSEDLKSLFLGLGKIEATPTVIDVVSLCTFRWIIMERPEDVSILNSCSFMAFL